MPKKDTNTSNKVKRNADDSNLISWNDIYDDEYGIQTDNFDDVRDKYSRKQDFIKRSGRSLVIHLATTQSKTNFHSYTHSIKSV